MTLGPVYLGNGGRGVVPMGDGEEYGYARHLLQTDVDELPEQAHRTESETLLLLLGMLVATIMVIWRFKVRRYQFLHETGVSMIFGAATGLVLHLVRTKGVGSRTLHSAVCNRTARATTTANVESETVFDPEIFFYVLLPPIIFHAGYGLKKKHFFGNFGAILTYAFAGTTISTFVTGFLVYAFSTYIHNVGLSLNDSLLFGALISATDPVTVLAVFHDLHVDVDLYALVFGESVLNDAVAIVLFSTILQYKPALDNSVSFGSVIYSIWIFLLTFSGSFAVGVLFAAITALVTKFTNIREFPMLETALFILLSYASFLFAEAFELTGIVAILFCGITQAHYTVRNMSRKARFNVKMFFEILNFAAENFIFSYIGLALFTYNCHVWSFPLIAWCLVVLIVARAANVFPLSWLINALKRNRDHLISPQFQTMMFFSGLRGAIAFALAMRYADTESRRLLLSTTLVIVFITVIVCGGGTVKLLEYLRVRIHVDEDDAVDYMLAGDGTRVRGAEGLLATMWTELDGKYLRPVLTLTPDMFGTESIGAIKRTIRNYFRGIPEEFRSGGHGGNHTSGELAMSSLDEISLSSDEHDADAEELDHHQANGTPRRGEGDISISGDISALHAWD